MAEEYVPVDPINITPASSKSWLDVDLDTYIASLPPNVTGVAIRVLNASSGGCPAGVRKDGSTDARTTNVTSGQMCFFCGVSSSKIFEIYSGSTTYITAYIVGYFKDVTFLTNATDVSSAKAGVWNDLDSGYNNAIGLILETNITSLKSFEFGFRKNGSTDNRTNVGVRRCGCFIIGADAGVSEQYISGTDQDTYLVGYITENATFYTNATDISLGSTGSYADLSVGSASAKANLIEVVASSTYDFGLRRNGASDDLYEGAARHACILVGADSSGVSEGKIADTVVDFFLLGYFLAAAGAVALAGQIATKSGLAAGTSVLRSLGVLGTSWRLQAP